MGGCGGEERRAVGNSCGRSGGFYGFFGVFFRSFFRSFFVLFFCSFLGRFGVPFWDVLGTQIDQNPYLSFFDFCCFSLGKTTLFGF